MISVDRFLVPSSQKDAWLAYRKTGVTATQVCKAATPSGFDEAVKKMSVHDSVEDNAYMKFGRDNEMWLALSLKDQFGILPNDWLIAAEQERWQMATPDGLSLDHRLTAEIKTTGRDWGEWKSVPIDYRRQVQWQLHVADAEACVFAWLLRKENKFGEFVPGWFAPKTVVVERDEVMITKLIDVANRLRVEQLKVGKAN